MSKTVTFATTLRGAPVRVAVEGPTERLTRGLATHLMDESAGWEPSGQLDDVPLPPLPAPPAGANAAQARAHFRQLEKVLAPAAARDARHTAALYAARTGAELAGDLHGDHVADTHAAVAGEEGTGVVVTRRLREGWVTCTIDTEAHELARLLADATWRLTATLPGGHALDFYPAVATRDLGVLAGFGPEYAAPLHLGDQRAIDAWLPRDVRDLLPSGWAPGADPELDARLLAGINALPGRRFVAVHPACPVDLGCEIALDDLAAGEPVYRGWV